MTEIISHSDAEKHSLCEWAHHYGYGYSLTTLEMPEHIQRGVLLHRMLAGYYGALRDKYNWDDSIDAGMAIYESTIAESITSLTPTFDLGICNEVKVLFDKYVEYYNPKEWEILWVEEYIEFPVSDQIILNGELDLVIRAKTGKLSGQLGIVDHKVLFNFMTTKEIETHSQLPKYIYAVNKLGVFDQKITFGILNQVRWREVKDINKLFSRIVLEPTEIKQAAFMSEYMKQCRRIFEKRQLKDPFFWKDLSARTTVKNICKNCEFESLCVTELEGGNPELTMKAFYKKKDYSYRSERNRVNGQPRNSEDKNQEDS